MRPQEACPWAHAALNLWRALAYSGDQGCLHQVLDFREHPDGVTQACELVTL